MKNAHPTILLLEMQRNYPYFPTPSLKRYCDHYGRWREALADYAGWSVDDSKAEITKLFYGARPTTELPFLMQLI